MVNDGGRSSLRNLGARYASEGYVGLPANLWAPLVNAKWSVDHDGAREAGRKSGRHRIVDFGDQLTSGSDIVGNDVIFLTPHGEARLASRRLTRQVPNETGVNGAAASAQCKSARGRQSSTMSNVMALYLHGDPEGTVAWTDRLSASILNDGSDDRITTSIRSSMASSRIFAFTARLSGGADSSSYGRPYRLFLPTIIPAHRPEARAATGAGRCVRGKLAKSARRTAPTTNTPVPGR